MDSPPSKVNIIRYTIITRIDYPQYGTLIYAREPNKTVLVDEELREGNLHESAVRVGNLKVVNVCKPPNSNWPGIPLRHRSHPTVIMGDFNCHHVSWGYIDDDADAAGQTIDQWAEANRYHVIISPRDTGTFYSGIWQRKYKPDLVFASLAEHETHTSVTREVLGDFPNSQHRTIVVTTRKNIKYTKTIEKPRWNFKRVNWTTYIVRRWIELVTRYRLRRTT